MAVVALSTSLPDREVTALLQLQREGGVVTRFVAEPGKHNHRGSRVGVGTGDRRGDKTTTRGAPRNTSTARNADARRRGARHGEGHGERACAGECE